MKYKFLKKKFIVSILPTVVLMPTTTVFFLTTSTNNVTEQNEQMVNRPDITITILNRENELFNESLDNRMVMEGINTHLRGTQEDIQKYRIPREAKMPINKIGVVNDGALYYVTTNCYLDLKTDDLVYKEVGFTVYVNGFKNDPKYPTAIELLNRKKPTVVEEKEPFTSTWYFYLIISLCSAIALTAIIVVIVIYSKKKINAKNARMRALGITKEEKKKKNPVESIEYNISSSNEFKNNSKAKNNKKNKSSSSKNKEKFSNKKDNKESYVIPNIKK